MTKPERLERAVTGVFILAALVLTGLAVRREFFPAALAAGGAAPSSSRLTFQAGCQDATEAGHVVGDPRASTKIIILSDLECPACRRVDGVVSKVRRSSRDGIAVVFVHFPLQMHRFAMPAARAAECAAAMGQFEDFVEHVYAKQDSLGLKSWGAIAKEAGIADTSRIAACATGTTQSPRIAAGLAFGRKIGVNATPTVIVNGWRFSGSPTEAELVEVIDAVKKGTPPPGADVSVDRVRE